MAKRTKIICTLGPATDDEGVLSRLLDAGMDVARLNFSHGTHAEHAERIARVRRACARTGSPCAILLDMRGPEIRTGKLAGGRPVALRAGDEIVLTEREVAGSAALVTQTCAGLSERVRPGTQLLVDDGLIELAVEAVEGADISCRVVNDAVLGERKSVNVPGVTVPLPVMTDQDRADILFGIEQDVDFVAASFVRSAEAVREIRAFLRAHGGGHVSLVAKIETAEAVEDIEAIVEASDGVMVARGDLGVEVPSYRVPHIQKKIIRLCNERNTPVITATQMLDSMIRAPRPTRAEVADVANAVYDGTDCLMLSGETAAGAYPVEAVRIMARIAEESEPYLREEAAGLREASRMEGHGSVSVAVGMAAVRAAETLGARCIVAPTMSGRSARLMASFRPRQPIYAVTPTPRVMRSMQLYWGVTPLLGDVQGDTDYVIEQARRIVLERGLADVGDIGVFTVGDRDTSPNADRAAFAPTNIMYVVELHPEDIPDSDHGL